MIDFAKQEDYDALTALWQEAFGDPVDYVHMFLTYRAASHNTLVYRRDNSIAAMLFILPCTITDGGDSYPCAYIYSVATKEACRGSGISTRLMAYADKLIQSRGYAVSVLVPATEELFMFYSKRGFKVQGAVRTMVIDATRLSLAQGDTDLGSITTEEILALRDKHMGRRYLSWGKEGMDYILREIRFLGGDFYSFDKDGIAGYIAGAPSDDTMIVKEFAGEPSMLTAALKGLHRIYGKSRYAVTLPDFYSDAPISHISMTKWHIPNPVEQDFYISHYLG